MSEAIWWFGAIHTLVYGVAGFVSVTAVLAEWAAKKLGVHKAIIQWLWSRAKARAAETKGVSG